MLRPKHDPSSSSVRKCSKTCRVLSRKSTPRRSRGIHRYSPYQLPAPASRGFRYRPFFNLGSIPTVEHHIYTSIVMARQSDICPVFLQKKIDVCRLVDETA